MCSCQVGCCARQICGLLFATLNSAICVLYIIALINLAVQCGEPCYPHYFTPHLYGLIMIASAVMLYITGFVLSWIAYKRGEGDIVGCNVMIVILAVTVLLGILALLCWNMFHLMTHAHLHHYPQLYSIMVIVNVAWNMLLLVISINVLQKSKEDKTKESFTELSPINEDVDNEDLSRLDSVDLDPMIPNKIDSFEDDDQWRQDMDSGPRNVYDDTAKWASEDSNKDLKKTKKKKKDSKKKSNKPKEKSSAYESNPKDNTSAYGSGFNNSKDNASAYGGDAFANKGKEKDITKEANPFGQKSESDNVGGMSAYDGNASAWA